MKFLPLCSNKLKRGGEASLTCLAWTHATRPQNALRASVCLVMTAVESTPAQPQPPA